MKKWALLFLLMLPFFLHAVFSKLGNYVNNDDILDFQCVDNIAYIANNNQGLLLVDISNPTDPQLISTTTLGNAIVRIQVEGTRAYLLNNAGQIVIYDISNPQEPSYLTIYIPSFPIIDFWVEAAIVYIGSEEEGIRIVDMTDVHSPRTQGTCPLQMGMLHLIKQNSNLFVTTTSGILRVDVSSLSFPHVVQTIMLPRPVNLLTAGNNQLFVSYETPDATGFYTYIIESSNQISFYNDKAVPSRLVSMQSVGDLLYTGDEKKCLCIYDAAFFSDQHLTGVYSTSQPILKIQLLNQIAYLATGNAGFQIVDLRVPGNEQLSHVYVSPEGYSFFAYGPQYVYEVAGSTLKILDFSNPDNITVISTWTVPSEVTKVYWADSKLYLVVAKRALHVYDLTNPLSPASLESTEFAHNILDVTADEGLTYIAVDLIGLQIMQFFAGTHPQLVGSYDTEAQFRKMCKIGSYLYAAAGERGFCILDVSVLASPYILAEMDTPGNAVDLVVFRDVAYVADSKNQVLRIDVSVPMAPATMPNFGPHSTSQITHLFMHNTQLLISDVNWNELTLFELDGVLMPTPVFKVRWNLTATQLHVQNNCIMANSDGYGLYFFPIDYSHVVGIEEEEAKPLPAISVFPNPVKSTASFQFAEKKTHPAQAAVFNLKGQKVREMGILMPGTQMVTWDGNNEKGQPVSAGIYFMRVQSAGRTQTAKFVVLK